MIMIRRIKGFITDMLYEDRSIRDRLFHLMIFMGAFASVIAVVSTVALGESWTVVLPLFSGMIVLWLTLWMSRRFHKTELMSTICVIVIDLFLFPFAFFASGAVEGGMNAWFVLALVFIFLLFSGKKFFFWLVVAIAEYGFVYYLAYLHPEWVAPLGSKAVIYVDSVASFVIVATAIGGVIKFQIMVFTREKAITEAQKEEIERISNSRNAFFVNISHEIRTPINTIIGLNDMILREDISDEIAENAQNVKNASKILLTLINDILDMSKIESGKMTIVESPYHVGDLLSDLVNVIWISAHEKDLEFKVQVSEEIPSVLCGDEVRVKQMILNLLSNAVKYTEKGSVTLNVKSVTTGDKRVRLIVSVEDTGIGIRKEVKETLFQPFLRADGEKDHKIQGTGLGLSITRQMVELMGGQITVDSVYTKGSIFTLSFEQTVVEEQPVGMLEFAARNDLKKREKYRQSFEAPKARILIVDDNEMNRMVAVKLLRATRVKVDTASGGRECLRKTLRRHYDVIFMDHKMPEMDGLETLRQLRKQEEGLCQNVPVIAMTANVMSDARQIYQEYGFTDYLEKPVDGRRFERMVMRNLPKELVERRLENPEPEAEDQILPAAEEKRKRQVIITTDCVCDLPLELLQKLKVKCMYYYVHVNGARFCDGKEITSDNLIENIAAGAEHIYSEPATVKEYETFFAEQLDEAEKVIHISMARHVSKGYDSARAAADCFDNVAVVDSGHLSSGMGIAVLTAAQMAEQKQSAEAILETLEKLRTRISSSFVVETTQKLYETNKISKRVRIFCEIFQLHPVLELSQSQIRCRMVYMGAWKRVLKKYVQRQLRNKGKIDHRILFITSAGVPQKQVEMIAEEVKKYVEFEHVIFQKASATVSSNCGKGTIGLLFARKQEHA